MCRTILSVKSQIENLNLNRLEFLIFFPLICSIFIILLYYGYHSFNTPLLLFLNGVKYLIVLLLAISIFIYYKTKSVISISPVILSLVIIWFAEFDTVYRWDAIQHVARTKYYMNHDIFSFLYSTERISFVYLLWGFIYHLFGESEIVTNIVNMITGFTGILGAYIIAKDIYGKFEAVITLIVALTLPPLFLVNLWANLDMAFMAFIVFTILFLVKFVKCSKIYFLWFSLIFALISTGTKEVGIILFPLIILTLLKYRLLTKQSIIPIITCALPGLLLFFSTIKFFAPHIGTSGKDFSIISPFSFGVDAIIMWFSSLNQEIIMLLCSGLLIIGIFSLFNMEKINGYFALILIAQFITIIGTSFFPTKYLYAFPVFPFQNFFFYYIPVGIVIGVTLLFLLMRKIAIDWSQIQKSWVLLIWVVLFLSFFMINSRISGLGIKNIFEVPILDFRYLIPALPPMIILFASGFGKAISSNIHSILKNCLFLLISLIIITNLIMSLNLSFYYMSSGDIHLQGYEKAKNLTDNNIIMSHWPFYYFPKGEQMDIGYFNWKSANITSNSISDAPLISGSALLFDSHFFSNNNVQFINFTTIESRSPYLDPILPEILEKNADTVFIGKVDFPSYEFGQVVIFGLNGTSQKYQVSGFSFHENGLTWTDGKFTEFVFKFSKSNDNLYLNLTAYPFLGGGVIKQQNVIVKVNERNIGEILFDKPINQEKSIVIPKEVFNDEVQYISFELPDAISPKALNLSKDSRELAIAINSMKISSIRND